MHLRVVDQQALQGQDADEPAIALHHEQLVGVVGQVPQAAQIAQRHLHGHVGADGDEVVIHEGADRVLRVAQGEHHLRPLGGVEGTQQLLHDVAGQVRRQVGDLVRVQAGGGGHQFLVVHGGDEGFPHRVRHLDQDVAVALGLDQVPHQEAVF